jgi:Ulp1 family protease
MSDREQECVQINFILCFFLWLVVIMAAPGNRITATSWFSNDDILEYLELIVERYNIMFPKGALLAFDTPGLQTRINKPSYQFMRGLKKKFKKMHRTIDNFDAFVCCYNKDAHWITAVGHRSRVDRSVFYMNYSDSIRANGSTILAECKRDVKKFMEKLDLRVGDETIMQIYDQKNGNDCGVYALLFVRHMLLPPDWDIRVTNQDDPDLTAVRAHMNQELLDQTLKIPTHELVPKRIVVT